MMNMIDNHIITINLMPKSQSQESTPEWERIDHSCSIGGSFPVILANSYQFVYCTSHQQASTKVLNMFKTFVFPNANTFHSWLCALKTCSFLLCCTSNLLYSGLFLLYSGCSNCILCCSYMYDFTRKQCEIRRTELEHARDCCKVDIRVNSC